MLHHFYHFLGKDESIELCMKTLMVDRTVLLADNVCCSLILVPIEACEVQFPVSTAIHGFFLLNSKHPCCPVSIRPCFHSRRG